MKLIIDINDRLYNDIRNCADVQSASHEAIKNGIPYERPTGEWITESKLYGGFGDSVLVNTCSICKTSFAYRGKTHNFCSNCGADMRGEDK